MPAESGSVNGLMIWKKIRSETTKQTEGRCLFRCQLKQMPLSDVAFFSFSKLVYSFFAIFGLFQNNNSSVNRTVFMYFDNM